MRERSPPTLAELEDAIVAATQAATLALFQEHPGRFYYLALITTGEAHAPSLSAWSREALEDALGAGADPTLRANLKWSYADSPFCGYGDALFEPVRDLFAERPGLTHSLSMEQWKLEYEGRLTAMERALRRLDSAGLFGAGSDRATIFINVEVSPPDPSNTERARRLNPPEALESWLQEAAE